MMKRIKRCLTVILSLAIVMTGIYWCEKPIIAVQASESNTDMLSLKFQRGQGNYSEKIRVVASIDSPNYKAVGFAIAINGGTEVCKEINTKEYPLPRRIEAQNMGVDYAYGPKVIDVSSEYFLTAKWTAKANTTYTVRAWADPLGGGDRIYGQSRCISLDDFTTSYLSMSFEMKNGNLKMSTDDGKTTYEDIKVTYNGAETTAKVVDVTQHGTSTTVHVNIQGVNHTALPSATKFVFKDSTGTTEYGSCIFRNLNPTTATNEADTSWHEVYSSEGENEFVIATTQDFYGFASLVNAGTFGTDKAYLCADLVMNDTSSITSPTTVEGWSGKTLTNTWAPAGNSEHAFEGKFYGAGHSIEGIYISDTSASNVGLFGLTDGAEIKNLILKNSYIKGGNIVGSIVGLGGGTITNVTSNAVVVATNKAGGFIGQVNGEKVTVEDCTFSGEAKATTQCAAGMIGEILDVTEANKTVIDNCVVNKDAKLTADASSTSGGRVGGIVGNVGTSYLEVSNSNFEGTIEAPGATLGGIVARVNKNTGSGSHVDITGCTSSGSATCSGSGNVYVGGLIGGIWEESVAEITQCVSTCIVSGENGNRVSGAVGQLGKSTVNFNEVYVGGTITAKEQCGGFVGRTEGNNATVNMTDCHFNGTLSVTTTGWGYAGALLGYVPGVSGKPHVITATRCLLTGTLEFDTASNYKCILIGNIKDYTEFTCKEGVYYIQDAKVGSTYKTQSSTGVSVTGVTGDGAVVQGFSAAELQGSNAHTNATALFTNPSDCKWNLPVNDTAYPTLKFLNVTE